MVISTNLEIDNKNFNPCVKQKLNKHYKVSSHKAEIWQESAVAVEKNLQIAELQLEEEEIVVQIGTKEIGKGIKDGTY